MSSASSVFSCAALVSMTGCAVHSPAPSIGAPSPDTATPLLSAPQSTASATTSSVPPAALTPVQRSAPLEVHAERVLAGPVTAIALGEGTRIAALAGEPYVGDERGLHMLPLPSALAPKPDQTDDLGIFFGRDNEPRIMGTRRSQAGEVSIYWRHLSSGWKDGREEIGQLGGSTRGGLWGVLGSADPELVCRIGSVCIIKRSTGWTTAPAGDAPRRVALQDGILWGLDSSGLANIDAHGWSVVMPAPNWSEPGAFWATKGQAWVAAGGELWHFRDGSWSTELAPIAEPLAFWGASAESVWMVGKGGAGHFDGHSWRVLSIAGPLAAIRGRADAELWAGGTAGLFRLRL